MKLKAEEGELLSYEVAKLRKQNNSYEAEIDNEHTRFKAAGS